MYVCGPTVYDLPHIGHGRANLTFDILRRYLSFEGLRVHHVANITDVDDNIIKRANELGRTEADVAAEFEAAWWDAMEALGDLRPHDIPHATEYIEEMVTLVSELEAKDVAYETDDGVYLEVARVPSYGLLALQPLDSLQSGARVEANDEKRSPLDFALWKKAKAGEPSWPSPWGDGRPGWHTECVVMSLDLLGEGFDLHGGGQDLRFPHHENERAQAVADGKEFARHWMHNGWVEVEGTKMSKSLGNFTTLPDLLARHDARAYRLLVLRAHYRSPIEVTPETIVDAEGALGRLDALARRFSVGGLLEQTPDGYVVEGDAPAVDLDPGALASFRAHMDDDLDTAARSPASSSWCPPRTRRPIRGTRTGPRSWPVRRRCSWRRWVCPSGGSPARSTRRRPNWWRNTTRPGRPRTTPGPMRCGTSWWRWGGRWRTRRRGRPSIAERRWARCGRRGGSGGSGAGSAAKGQVGAASRG